MEPADLALLLPRFLRRVEERGPEECWPWTGTITHKGYGKITLRGVEHRAHRVAYQHHTGEDPGDDLVLHSCDNPPCCNGRHLRRGTHAENQAEKAAKGRSARGERNGGGGKLTEADVRAMRASDDNFAALGRRYGISRTMAANIVKGHAWSHV